MIERTTGTQNRVQVIRREKHEREGWLRTTKCSTEGVVQAHSQRPVLCSKER
jgi:hypothetical protein